MLALKQSAVRLAMLYSKHVVHVVEFDEVAHRADFLQSLAQQEQLFFYFGRLSGPLGQFHGRYTGPWGKLHAVTSAI